MRLRMNYAYFLFLGKVAIFARMGLDGVNSIVPGPSHMVAHTKVCRTLRSIGIWICGYQQRDAPQT